MVKILNSFEDLLEKVLCFFFGVPAIRLLSDLIEDFHTLNVLHNLVNFAFQLIIKYFN